MMKKVIVLVLFLIEIPVVSWSEPGDLDDDFGQDGKVVFPLGGSSDHLSRILLQPDGKIVLIGTGRISAVVGAAGDRVAIIRLNQDGSPDENFGSHGIAFRDFGYSSFYHRTSGALQRDGKIVVGSFGYLSRWTTSGRLDTGFGSGGIIDLNNPSNVPGAQNASEGIVGVWDLVIQPDGKIVAVGDEQKARPLQQQGSGNILHFGVLRFLPNGELDRSFDGDGMNFFHFGGTERASPTVVRLQADLKMLVGGLADDQNYTLGLARLGREGRLDSSFGIGGKVTIPLAPPASGPGEIMGIFPQSDGTIIVGGRLRVESFSPTGVRNPSFAPTYHVANATYGSHPGNKIVFLAGRCMGRLNLDGTGDETFALNSSQSGTERYKLCPPAFEGSYFLYAIQAQSDGKILVGGDINGHIVLMRFVGGTRTVSSEEDDEIGEEGSAENGDGEEAAEVVGIGNGPGMDSPAPPPAPLPVPAPIPAPGVEPPTEDDTATTGTGSRPTSVSAGENDDDAGGCSLRP